MSTQQYLNLRRRKENGEYIHSHEYEGLSSEQINDLSKPYVYRGVHEYIKDSNDGDWHFKPSPFARKIGVTILIFVVVGIIVVQIETFFQFSNRYILPHYFDIVPAREFCGIIIFFFTFLLSIVLMIFLSTKKKNNNLQKSQDGYQKYSIVLRTVAWLSVILIIIFIMHSISIYDEVIPDYSKP